MKVRSLVALSVLVITAGVALTLKAHGGGGGGFGAAFGGSLAGSYVGTSVANSSQRNNGGGCECNCRSMQRQIDNLQKQLDKCRGNN